MPYKHAYKDSGKTVIYKDENGNRFTHSGGTPAWRNNNPGNLKKGDFARRHGAIGEAGPFAIFPNPETGRKAMIVLLGTSRYQTKNIGEAINEYAPSNENDTEAYKKFIAKTSGLPLDKRMDSLTPEEMNRVVSTIEKYEGAQKGKIEPFSNQQSQQEMIKRPLDEVLARPEETWSEAEVNIVHTQAARLGPSNPKGMVLYKLIGAWHDHFYGKVPVKYDATGRMIDPSPIRKIPEGGGGPVHVRAYARDGGKTGVAAYDRSRPGG